MLGVVLLEQLLLVDLAPKAVGHATLDNKDMVAIGSIFHGRLDSREIRIFIVVVGVGNDTRGKTHGDGDGVGHCDTKEDLRQGGGDKRDHALVERNEDARLQLDRSFLRRLVVDRRDSALAQGRGRSNSRSKAFGIRAGC